MKRKLEAISPGEILMEEFMRPMDISQNKLARELGVNAARVHEIIHARRGISAETALRLSAYFGTTAEFWLNLQSRYDLKLAERTYGNEIKKRIRPADSKAA